jgi:secreted trypsin-like serine protease
VLVVKKNQNDKTVMIVGIVSYGPGSGTSSVPNIFTRVTSFIVWINIMLYCELDCIFPPPTSENLQWNGFVRLMENADSASSNFNQNQGNSADPGGPLIVRENDDRPIIYGLFFL